MSGKKPRARKRRPALPPPPPRRTPNPEGLVILGELGRLVEKLKAGLGRRRKLRYPR